MEKLYLFVNLLCFGVSIRLSSIQVQSEAIEDDTIDLCQTHNFEPKCGPDEVVVMKSAKYGRMKLGSCVRTDYGYVGCYVDVLHLLDRACSGSRTCNVEVPNSDLENAIVNALNNKGTCGTEMKNYLSVSYKCMKVESDACYGCAASPTSKVAKVMSSEGYIGSVVTREDRNKCGTARCPWTIEVQPGQNINVSIYDFGDQKDYSLPSTCFRYGYIEEKHTLRDTPLCADRDRFRHVYTSVSHTIQLKIVSPEALANRAQFLVYYQAVGCADLMVDDNMWTKRLGDKLEVGCDDDSTQTWQLTCEGTEWKGARYKCPLTRPTESPEVTLPLVVLIAIVVAIALVVGVLILTIGIVFLKRQHSTRMNGSCYYRPRHDYDYPMGVVGQPETYVAPKITGDPSEPSKYQPVMHSQQRTSHLQNWYKRPLPSLPNIAEASGGSASTVSRSDDDPQLMHAAEVHRSDSDRERRYLTNPRPSANRLQQPNVTGGGGSSGPVVVPVPPPPPPPGPPNPQGGVTGGGNRRLNLRDGPQYFVLDGDNNAKIGGDPAAQARRAARAANARAAAAILEQEEEPEKSPEEENEENDSKEFSRNNSWHEITLRPTRVSAANVNNTSTENTTGKTSWP